MKYIILILLSVKITLSYWQTYYKVSYSNGEMRDIITLTIGKDCFKIKDRFHGLVKAKNEKKWYSFYQNTPQSCIAAETKPSEYLGADLFKKSNAESYIKIDTVVPKKDTLISNILCKKINVNYVNFFENENKQLKPYDTVFTTFYVAPQLAAHTPFSFVSKKVEGLILKYSKAHPTYSIENDKVIKSYMRTDISSSVHKISSINDEFFKLPKTCKYLKSYEKFLGVIGKDMETELKDLFEYN